MAWLNADEYYLPDGLRVFVEEGERTKADVVYGDCVTVDRDGRIEWAPAAASVQLSDPASLRAIRGERFA